MPDFTFYTAIRLIKYKYGYQNFDNYDKSRNSLMLDFLMMGELFQNNHHKRPNSANLKWPRRTR